MSPTYYQIVQLIHILAGIAWLGSGFTIQVTLYRARSKDGLEAADRVLESFGWADTWLAIPAPLLVVGTGITMAIVSGAWRFLQAWIWLSLAVLVVYEGIAGTLGVGSIAKWRPPERKAPSPISNAATR